MRPLFRVAVLAFLLTLAACSGSPTASAPTSSSTSTPAAAVSSTNTPAPTPTVVVPPTVPAATLPITVTDALGRQVSLKAVPTRIVSLAPSVTEILFAVGAGSRVVGVTKYCTYPPEVEALPKIGGFSPDSISVEAIVNLTPDLVVAGTVAQAPVVEALTRAGIAAVVLDPKSFADVYAGIAQVGQLTGTTAQANAVVAAMRARIDAVTAKVAADVPAAERPTVFYEVFDQPLMTAGPNTFVGQMLTFVGATSIFTDTGKDYPMVSAEAILTGNPDVILGPDSHGEQLSPAQIAQRPGWGELKAVKTGRIYLLSGDMVSRPGPRLAEALEALAKTLYPKLFP